MMMMNKNLLLGKKNEALFTSYNVYPSELQRMGPWYGLGLGSMDTTRLGRTALFVRSIPETIIIHALFRSSSQPNAI